MRLFAGDRIYNIMERFKVPDDQPMEAKILSNQIENAQKKVEEQNFVARKNVLKYDDVLNKQRTVIYEQRRRVLEGEDLSEEVSALDRRGDRAHVAQYTRGRVLGGMGPRRALQGDAGSLRDERADHARGAERGGRRSTARRSSTSSQEDARDTYAEKEKGLGLNPDTDQPLMRDVERFVILQVVDVRWREHLENMDYLREGVHLRAMAQKDPLVEYTSEGHAMFEELNAAIREEVVHTLFHAEIEVEEAGELQQAQAAQALDGGGFAYEHESLAGAQAIAAAGAGPATLLAATEPRSPRAGSAPAAARSRPQQRVIDAREENIGRNDPCWCGSGKKFKRATAPDARHPTALKSKLDPDDHRACAGSSTGTRRAAIRGAPSSRPPA